MAAVTLRPPGSQDVARLVEIHNLGRVELGQLPTITADDVSDEWRAPGFEKDRHARVAVLDGIVVGSTEIFVRDDMAMIDGFVERSARGRGAGTALLTWALEAAAAEPGVREIYVGTPRARADGVALIEAQHGVSYVRSFFLMRHERPNDVSAPRWPDGIEVARLEGEDLAQAIAAAYDASFVDHWNFRPADVGRYLHEIQQDPDPDRWLVVTRNGEIAGFCLTYLEEGRDASRGIVWQVGTTRPFRGIGLGRALLREGVSRLARRGVEVVELGVDAENQTAALALYRSTGFHPVQENRVYRRAVPPAGP